MKTNSIKTIVVGIDFSPYSKLVAEEAQELAKILKVPMVSIFCFEELALYQQNILLNRQEITQLYEAKIREYYHLRSKDKVVIRFGQAEKEITVATKSFASPLLVVGYQSGHRMARVFLGSVAEGVLAKATFPVWIHRGKKVIVPRKILIPSDLSKTSEKTIREVKYLQKKFSGTSEIFHVVQKPVPILDFQAWKQIYEAIKMEDDRKLLHFKKRHPKLNTVRVRGYIAEDIEKRAKNFDLIAIAPRNAAKTHRLLGGISSKVIRHGEKPILVVP